MGTSDSNYFEEREVTVGSENWKKYSPKTVQSMDCKGPLLGAFGPKPQDCTKCKHQCSTKVTEDVRLEIFTSYWAPGQDQSEFVNNYVQEVPVKYQTLGHTSRRNRTMAYYLPCGEETVKVCRDMFLNTICLGKEFIYRNKGRITMSNTE